MTIRVNAAEYELVLLLSTPELSDREGRRLRELLDAPLDWSVVLGALAIHRTGGVAWHNILRHAIDHRQTLRSAYHFRSLRVVAAGQAALASEQLAFTAALQRGLDDVGVRSAVLKGAAVAAMAYADPSMRSFHDNDVLIDRDRLPEAANLLESMGYIQGSWDYTAGTVRAAPRRQVLHMAMHSHQTYSYMLPTPESDLLECHRVDLHLSVDLMTGIRSDAAVASLLANRVEVGALVTAAPVDMLIFCCLHFSREAVHRNEVLVGKDLVLYKIVDILALLAVSDTAGVADRARELGFLTDVNAALQATARLYPGRVDPALLAEVRTDGGIPDTVVDGERVVHRWRAPLEERMFDTLRYLELSGDLTIAVPGVTAPGRTPPPA